MKYLVIATRTYYSSIDFEVEASDYNEASNIAEKMIEDCKVEFTSFDAVSENDEIEIWLMNKEQGVMTDANKT